MLRHPLLPNYTSTLYSPQNSGNSLVTHHSSSNQPISLSPESPPRWQQLANKTNPLPLTVAIGASGISAALVQKALTAWETSTKLQVRFNLLANPTLAAVQSADILIVWADPILQQSTQKTSYNTGKAWLHVKASNNRPIIMGSTIELTKVPLIDAYISKQKQTDRLYTTVLHELGHALGLKHAKNATSIMHPEGWKNTQLTPEDAGLFFQLYGTT